MSCPSPPAQPNAPEARDFLGRKIYTIPLPPRRAPGGAAPVSRSLYCAAGGGYVAMTTEVSMIEEYLRNADSKTRPLRETPGLAGAAQHVGGAGNGLFGYQNQRETMRMVFAALKNNPTAAPGGGSSFSPGFDTMGGLPLMGGAGKGLRDWMDFALLPDYDKVSKYFYFSVSGGSMTADGITFKIFAPRPPQMGK